MKSVLIKNNIACYKMQVDAQLRRVLKSNDFILNEKSRSNTQVNAEGIQASSEKEGSFSLKNLLYGRKGQEFSIRSSEKSSLYTISATSFSKKLFVDG